MTDMQEFMTGDRCRITYRFDGDPGRPILILSNSIATTHRMWDGQMAALTQIFRILRYDTRGHGGSDAPVGAYSFDRLGRDLLELMDALEIERAHFCGLSLGGFIGQWLGAHAPDRLDKLVLANTSPYLGPAPQWDELIRTVLDERNMAAMADMFVGNWFPPSMIDGLPQTIDQFRQMILSTSPEGLAGCFAAVRDADMRRTNSVIPLPTLVIGGADDSVTLASHSEDIAATIPDARLLMMQGVHMLNVERQDAFVAALTQFLHDDGAA